MLHEVRDPRLAGVTVSDVRVTTDLRVARIYVRHLAARADARGLVGALERAAPFLRRRLGQRAELRRVPELRFEYDRLVDEAARMDRLIDEITTQDGDE